MSDAQKIGGLAVWNVKDFSVEMRKAITEAARERNCTVAEWLHAYFHKHGIEGAEINPVRITAIKGPAPARSVEELCQIAHAAARVAETADKMDRGLRVALNRNLRAEARERLALPAPATEG